MSRLVTLKSFLIGMKERTFSFYLSLLSLSVALCDTAASARPTPHIDFDCLSFVYESFHVIRTQNLFSGAPEYIDQFFFFCFFFFCFFFVLFLFVSIFFLLLLLFCCCFIFTAHPHATTMTSKQIDSSPRTTTTPNYSATPTTTACIAAATINNDISGKKRAHNSTEHNSSSTSATVTTAVQRERQQPHPNYHQHQQQRRRRLFPAASVAAAVHDPRSTLLEQYCCDVPSDRPIVLRSPSHRDDDDDNDNNRHHDTTLSQCAAPPALLSDTQQLPPRVLFFLERRDHGNAVAWRQMLSFAHRLRSLTRDVFPLLHQRIIAIYWCRPRTVTTSVHAFNKHGALFFNAAAAANGASDPFRCFQVVCHELAHCVEIAHNGRFIAAIDECERAHFPAFWGFYVNHLIDDDDSEGAGCSGKDNNDGAVDVVDLTL
jgi:hypothetical protein